MKRIITGMGSVGALLVAGCGATFPTARVSLAASSTCAATPVRTTPFPGVLNGLSWIAATPLSAGVTGHLFYGSGAHGPATAMHTRGMMPGGGSTKILWVIARGNVGDALTLAGRNLSGPGTTKQSFQIAEGAGVPGTQFPSIVDVPTPGCWQFHLRSGSVAGTVTIRVMR